MTGAPIGIFDSGVGGLTVAREIRQLLPNEPIVYFADTAHCPYGRRGVDEVTELSAAATEALLQSGAKVIVVACNSASGAALVELRKRYDVPFVGMVPAVKPACASSSNGRIGVLATALTVHADLFSDVVNRYAGECRLTIQTCPGLAEAVERGDADAPETRSLLAGYLRPLQAAGVDVVVLGCTHYPLLTPHILEEMGPEVVVLDSSAPVALQVGRVLSEHDLKGVSNGSPEFALIGNGDLSVARRIAGQLGLLGSAAAVSR